MQTVSADPWEITRSSIKLGRRLGEGFFGVVYQGLYNNTPVAVKTLRHGTMDPRDFLKEAQIMKTMEHPNLIQLLAVCTEEPIYIITELMKNGSLLDYLKVRVGRLHLNDQIEMAAQVASGMAYLEMKKYIHRDLAARNVLVGENNVYKVADFGLARVLQAPPNQTNLYYIPVGKAIFPLRWTAPEAIANEKFTIKCDVWSFGILLYEIMTFGEMPYPVHLIVSDMNNSQVKQRVPNGYRMPRPVDPYCSQDMYKIMLDCWNGNKNDRPTFEALKMSLRNVRG
ncbi:tyrosine-protein kinase FRK isoform X1 [Oncorhynchus mykiss]|uniref:tyrosine-protein kinase FRK isoform X1 n=1 Tax=Oncorhynchus mykiss TaxID=8022 RepID=UPI001878354D|nr:tyrosine-protein kinase FRK isoform X1 [Oncorhynchus mykiss]